MKKLLVLGVLISVLGLSSCKDRCESVKTGEVTLLDESRSFAPYEEGESLTYVNAEGSEMVLELSRNHSLTDKNCVKYLCELSTGPYEPVVCEYYNSESAQNLYRIGDTIIIDVLAYMSLYEEENTLFYDALRVYMSGIGTLSSGEAVLAPRFTNPPFDENQVYLLEELVFENTVELQGQSYAGVWRTKTGENMVWVKSGIGLLAFQLDGELWVLQE
ncbi:MAG: hypothetical protein KDC34_16610 [Saprospiraceae bacterium]|nr:hypothetical protein [Saprospiraceae bacterium]